MGRTAIGPCIKCHKTSGSQLKTGQDGFQTLCSSCNQMYITGYLPVYMDGSGRMSILKKKQSKKKYVIGFHRRKSGHRIQQSPILSDRPRESLLEYSPERKEEMEPESRVMKFESRVEQEKETEEEEEVEEVVVGPTGVSMKVIHVSRGRRIVRRFKCEDRLDFVQFVSFVLSMFKLEGGSLVYVDGSGDHISFSSDLEIEEMFMLVTKENLCPLVLHLFS